MNGIDKKAFPVRIGKLLHFLVIVLSFYALWMHSHMVGQPESRYNLYITTLYAFCIYFFDRTYNAYLVGFKSAGDLAYSMSLSCTLTICGIYLLTAVAWVRFYNPLPFLGLLFGQIVFNLLSAKLLTWLYFRLYPPKRTCVIYCDDEDLVRIHEIENSTRQFSVERYIRNPQEDIDRLIEEIRSYEVVFVAGVKATFRNGIAKYCVENDVKGYFLPHVGDIIMAGAEHVQSYSVPIMRVSRKANNAEFLFIKRFFDIFLSLIALILASPFMLITAIAIRSYDGGPALYKQIRLTKDGKEFKILKFRSMRVDAEKDGVARLSAENDDRITPVGKVIRAIRFDELPQLVNILRGDMSIVGPRPERPEIAAEYREWLPAFDLRLQVKAGLTGYAQVYGKYNTDPHDKLEMDLLYINKMDIITDIMLIFATIRILFMKDSTSGIEAGQTTASRQGKKRKPKTKQDR